MFHKHYRFVYMLFKIKYFFLNHQSPLYLFNHTVNWYKLKEKKTQFHGKRTKFNGISVFCSLFYQIALAFSYKMFNVLRVMKINDLHQQDIIQKRSSQIRRQWNRKPFLFVYNQPSNCDCYIKLLYYSINQYLTKILVFIYRNTTFFLIVVISKITKTTEIWSFD